MDVLPLLCPICIVLFIFFSGELLSQIRLDRNLRTFPEKIKYDIVIAVLSTRNNFKRRAILRHWFKQLIGDDEDGILFRFIVASQPCNILAQDRLDEYSCKKLFLGEATSNPTEAYAITDVSSAETFVPTGVLGYDFIVHRPVILTELGVFDYLQDGIKQILKVYLYDTISKEVIVSVEFNSTNYGQLSNHFRYQPTPAFELPVGFRGSIVVDGWNTDDLSMKNIACKTSKGVSVSYVKGYRYSNVPNMFPYIHISHMKDSCNVAIGSMKFISKHLPSIESESERKAKLDKFEAQITEESLLLTKEIETYSDIFLANVTEDYRSLPEKMKQFYYWSAGQLNFRFLLKTDDDCFVNIPMILKKLHSEQIYDRNNIWWGGFRENWPLDRYGKWAENEYRSSVYPAFACGSGNILSYDLVKWLSNNTNRLKSYQGEDVSLGIWLASIHPTVVNDPSWHCFGDVCADDMLSSPDHSEAELNQMYSYLLKRGKPCILYE